MRSIQNAGVGPSTWMWDPAPTQPTAHSDTYLFSTYPGVPSNTQPAHASETHLEESAPEANSIPSKLQAQPEANAPVLPAHIPAAHIPATHIPATHIPATHIPAAPVPAAAPVPEAAPVPAAALVPAAPVDLKLHKCLWCDLWFTEDANDMDACQHTHTHRQDPIYVMIAGRKAVYPALYFPCCGWRHPALAGFPLPPPCTSHVPLSAILSGNFPGLQ